ncbi:MAG: molybdenum cofactor biosynthesis protein, partial [Legionella longbeachae]|nr:molybdenum cofactor biosynthesis protein [Legionella longbeachae]
IEGASHTPFSWLSRAVAGLYENTLIISFPGSCKAVEQGIEALQGLLPHVLNMIQGETHDQLS